MRRFLISIGILTLAFAGTVHAAQSDSFTLTTDFSNAESETAATSPSFSVTDGEVTWYRQPSQSNTFQIVPPMGTSSSSSSSSSSSTGGTSGGTTGGGTRPGGGYPGSGTPTPGSSSSSISSTSSSVSSSSSSTSSSVSSSSSSRTSSSRSSSSQSSDDGLHGAPSSEPSSPVAQLFCPDVIVATPSLCEIPSDGLMCPYVPSLHGAAPLPFDGALALDILFIAIALLLLCLWKLSKTKDKKKAKKKSYRAGRMIAFVALIAAAVFGACVAHSFAAQTVPEEHIYNGRLLNASGTPITTAHTIRFSYWKSADAVTGDVDGAGAIDTSAVTYAQWQEVHTVTPNSSGYFSVELGSITPIPNYKDMQTSTLLDLFIQVEVKADASPDTSYEILDVDGSDATIDRSSVRSVPFASNADTIDQREIGTGSGSIPFLGSGSKLPVSVIPGGTQADEFILDANDSETSEIALQFGAALAKKLSFDITNGTFVFNDDLKVQGNLVVTGLINGVNVTQLQSSTGALKASSGGGLNLNVAFGSFRRNGETTNYFGGTIVLQASSTQYVFFGSGGLTASTLGFPTDESMIPIAETITNGTAILSVLDRRVLSSDDREFDRTMTFNPEFEKAAYQGDGADNVGQLSISHDSINLRNFYLWTSTKSTLQDYDVLLRIPVSPDFIRWQTLGAVNPLTLMYRSTSANAADNKLDIQVYDTNGTPVTLSGSTTNLVNTSWSTSNVEFTGTPTWTPGQDMLIRLKVSAKDDFQMQIGGLKLNFTDFQR